MPIFTLTKELNFPQGHLADESGILAIGGDLNPLRLLSAYEQGIFPWPHEGYPLLWFCPPKRFVVKPNKIYIGRTLRKEIKNSPYEIRFDTCFHDVILGCKDAYRVGQDQTWITDEMVAGYTQLHELGFAHSIEAYENGMLVGGLYGVSLGGFFFGESMFSERKNASKTALATLAAHLIDWQFDLIDCQAETNHLKRFGAAFIDRTDFLKALKKSLHKPTRRGHWTCELNPMQVLTRLLDDTCAEN